MTLDERLADAHQRSVALYLRRTALEEQKQMLHAQGMSMDRELLKLDGEIGLLDRMKADANG